MSSSARREIPQMRGPGRAIAVLLVVLLLLLVAADVGLRLWAQAWLSHRIERTLDLPRAPDVSLGAFPFLPEFARGRLARVEMDMEAFVVDGLLVDRAEIRLQGVEFAQGDLLVGRAGTVAVERGSARVVVGERSLNMLLRDRDVPVGVELLGPRVRASATIEVDGEEATATAGGRLRLEDGVVVFRPSRVRVDGDFGVPPAALGFELPLPPVIDGMTYERVRVEEGRAILEASLDRSQVELGRP